MSDANPGEPGEINQPEVSPSTGAEGNPMEQLLREAQEEAAAAEDASYRVKLHPPQLQESIFGGWARYTAAEAIDPKSGQPVETPPVYFTGGYGNVKTAPHLVNLAQSGMNAFSVTLEGKRDSDTSFMAINNRTGTDYRMKDAYEMRAAQASGEAESIISRHQMNKAATLLAAMEEFAISKADVLAQSEGALHALLAANTQPNKFGVIVLAYPAGHTTQHNLSDAPRNVAHNERYKYQNKVAPENSFKADYAGEEAEGHKQKVAPGAIVDGGTVALSDHSEVLSDLRSDPDAPGVAMVAGLDDAIYPPEEYLRKLKSASDIDVMLVTEGGHGTRYRRDVMEQIKGLSGMVRDMRTQMREARDNGIEITREPLRNRLILPAGISGERRERLLALADEVDARTE